MTRTAVLLSVITLLGLLFLPPLTFGCSCVLLASPRCDTSWAGGEFIFVGTVASKTGGEIPLELGGFRLTGYEVRFSSTDILRGTAPMGAPITVYTGSGGGDCGYPFELGRRYLVYAFGSAGHLTTAICTETAPVEMASATIAQLRKLRDGRPLDGLFGNIGTAPTGSSYEARVTARPLPKVAVHAVGKDRRRVSTSTDEEGGYAFPSLPRSEYALHPDLPNGFRSEKDQVIDLKRPVNHLGCRVDFFARPDGRVSGRIANPQGIRLAGQISIEPADPDEAIQAKQRGAGAMDETEDGTFSFDRLFPGTYRLIFHPKRGTSIQFQKTITWPPLGIPGLHLKLGQHIDGVKIEAPETTPE